VWLEVFGRPLLDMIFGIVFVATAKG